MAILPIDEKGLVDEGLTLLPLTKEGQVDITYKIPLPGIFYKPFDWLRKGVNWISDAFPEDKPTGPASVPAPGAAGGSMKYRGHWLSKSYLPETGEKFYRWLKNKATTEGFSVNEMDYYRLNKMHSYPYPIQAHEDGANIDLMAYDKDGKRVTGWKKARELLHEYAGAAYFTRRGRSHMANESKVQPLADRLEDELFAESGLAYAA